MFKVRQIVLIVLQLAQGIFEILKEASDFTQLEESLSGLVQQASSQLITYGLEEIDRKLSGQRQRGLKIIGKRQRTLVTSAGEITISRRMYRQEDGKYRFLLDEALGLQAGCRISPRMQELATELATEMPYRRAAKVMSYLAPGVNTMTVWNAIQTAGERVYQEAQEQKKAVLERGEVPEGEETPEQLNIEGDEVYIKQQGGSKKGLGLKLVVGYQGKESSRLQNRYSVAGIANGTDIWDETACRFGRKWKLSQVKKVAIGGDGAGWIKQGLDYFPGASYHLDLFHLRKRLTEALSYSSSSYQEVCDGIARLDREATMGALNRAMSLVKGVRRKRIKELKTYLSNNWEGISHLPQEQRLGAIEGQIRHTLARRMKRIGARWSIKGADRMGRLLAAKSNGELSNYVKKSEVSLGKLVELDEPIKKSGKQENIEEWVMGNMPALQGPHSSRFWVKHVLKELASIGWSA